MKTMQQQLQEAYLGMKGILSEEDEQVVTEILALDELSKKTLFNYIQKAAGINGNSMIAHGQRATQSWSSEKDAEKHSNKARNRSSGVVRAASNLAGRTKNYAKLTKEEFEESLDEMLELLDEEVLTELSKKTLGSYIKAAAKYGQHDSRDAGYSSGTGSHRKEGLAAERRAFRRLKGITKATNRLTKEQKELIGSVLEELMDESDSFENEISESFESAAKKALQLHGKADKTEAEHKRLKYHLDNANRDKMFLKSKDIIKHKDLLDKIRAISKD